MHTIMRGAGLAAVLAAGLAACCGSEPPDTVESLMADEERLEAIMARCREHWQETGEQACAMARDAWRRRFMGRERRGPSGDVGHG